jgi:hypothetical protein
LALVAAIESLPEREKMMMALYYEQDLNLREIGEVLGVTESRVCQLHSQAIARLRVAVVGDDKPIGKTRRGRKAAAAPTAAAVPGPGREIGFGSMDKISVAGLALGIAAIIVGQVLEGGHVGSLIQPTAMLIVLGGTLGAVMLQSPLPVFMEA